MMSITYDKASRYALLFETVVGVTLVIKVPTDKMLSIMSYSGEKRTFLP